MSKKITRTATVPGEVKESDLWRTEQKCFDFLDNEFGSFHVDLAANETDHLCRYWFGPGGLVADSLKTRWNEYSRGFLNPPYSQGQIAPFLEKAILEASYGFTTVALLPDTHDTVWYRLLEGAAEIRRIPYRVKYRKADGATQAGAMFPSCVAVFRPQPGVRDPRPRIVTWSYR